MAVWFIKKGNVNTELTRQVKRDLISHFRQEKKCWRETVFWEYDPSIYIVNWFFCGGFCIFFAIYIYELQYWVLMFFFSFFSHTKVLIFLLFRFFFFPIVVLMFLMKTTKLIKSWALAIMKYNSTWKIAQYISWCMLLMVLWLSLWSYFFSAPITTWTTVR